MTLNDLINRLQLHQSNWINQLQDVIRSLFNFYRQTSFKISINDLVHRQRMSNIIRLNCRVLSYSFYYINSLPVRCAFLFVADFKIESGLSLSEDVNNEPIKMIILSFSLSLFFFNY